MRRFLEFGENLLSLERLQYVLREILVKGESAGLWESVALLLILGIFLGFLGRWVKRLEAASRKHKLSTRQPRTRRSKSTCRTLATEQEYQEALFRDYAAIKGSQQEAVEAFIFPQVGPKLITMPPSFYASLRHGGAARHVRLRYYFLFDSHAVSLIAPGEITSFLDLYRDFAVINLVFLTPEVRERQRIPSNPRNVVAFCDRQIAYSHGRNAMGQFIEARRETRYRALRLRNQLESLKALAKSEESIEVSESLRKRLYTTETKPTTSAREAGAGLRSRPDIYN